MSTEWGAVRRRAILRTAKELTVLLELLEDVTLPDFEVERVESDAEELARRIGGLMWRGVHDSRVMREETP